MSTWSESKIKKVGLIIIIPLMLLAIFISYQIGFNSKADTTQANNKSSSQNSTNSSQNNSSLPQPIDVSPIPASSTPLRVDFTRSSYNETVDKMNDYINEIKKYIIYTPNKYFCDLLGSIRSEAQFNLRPLQLDINYNYKAPIFEKIVNDTREFELACEQHLAGSTGLLDEYKQKYVEYITNLKELEKVE